MKLLLKVFFYLLTIFNANIVEARVVVFDAAVSEIKLSISDIKGENYSTIILENDFDITCKTENALVAYRNWRDKRWTVASKTGTKLLSQFNSVESLIQGAGNLKKVNAGLQGFVKGDGPSIFKAITIGSVGKTSRGGIIMKDGTIIFNHFSTKTAVYIIDINKAGQIYKIRIIP